MEQQVRCAYYLRSASTPQVGFCEKEQLESYIFQSCKTLCGDHNYQVSITPYKDLGFSGMDRNRPALNRLLRDIEDDKIEIIIVQSLSDLTRCNAHLAELWQFFRRFGIMVLITHMMPVEVAA